MQPNNERRRQSGFCAAGAYARAAGTKIKRPEHRSGLLLLPVFSAYFTVSAMHTAPVQLEFVEVACCTLVPFDEYADTTTEYVPVGVP